MPSDDPKKKSGESEKVSEGLISDAVKKIATLGVGAWFMTEEMIRQTLGDLKLPKDMLGKLLSNANKGKDELIKAFSNEFKKVLNTLDVPKEFEEFLENHEVKIDAKISFTPKNKK